MHQTSKGAADHDYGFGSCDRSHWIDDESSAGDMWRSIGLDSTPRSIDGDEAGINVILDDIFEMPSTICFSPWYII